MDLLSRPLGAVYAASCLGSRIDATVHTFPCLDEVYHVPLNTGSNFRMLRFCDEDFETLLAVEDGLIMLSKLPDGSGAQNESHPNTIL